MGLFDRALKIMDEQKDNTFEPLPENDYQATISNIELKPTKKGDGQRLNITFEVTAGKYAGRLVFAGLNVMNSNDDAVAISLGELHRICETAGAETWFNTFRAADTWEEAEKLIEGKLWDSIGNAQMMIRVKVKEDKSGQYGPSNTISKYAPVDAPAIKSKSAEPAAKKAPWAK